MTHLCSAKVIHTKNGIWRSASACQHHHPRRRRVSLSSGEGESAWRTDVTPGVAFGAGQTGVSVLLRWVTFREQTMVISRECRSVQPPLPTAGHAGQPPVAFWGLKWYVVAGLKPIVEISVKGLPSQRLARFDRDVLTQTGVTARDGTFGEQRHSALVASVESLQPTR